MSAGGLLRSSLWFVDGWMDGWMDGWIPHVGAKFFTFVECVKRRWGIKFATFCDSG